MEEVASKLRYLLAVQLGEESLRPKQFRPEKRFRGIKRLHLQRASSVFLVLSGQTDKKEGRKERKEAV